ncbi:hypothetical protein [Aquabacterium humicola]|uniref:hypothetical protein n=1 Tax=Aquabacterium humicola TaxID=3237377 RepID=UPI0025432FC4|nr:hypothetical protein [Rubrivivax pictus]
MARGLRVTLSSVLVLAVPFGIVACAGMAGGGSGGGSGPFSFFVTSTGTGNGANLGGLTGADQHCQSLAAAAGAGGQTWRAYLSTQARDGAATVNARDRIGKGPWYNKKGELIARDVEHLHSASNNIAKATALNEKGEVVSGRGDTPNRHDILTGSRSDGNAFSPNDPDMTCGNWTRSGAEGAVMVGHHDKIGPTGDPWATSWNSSHQSRGGCSLPALKGTGGDGLLYCFAAQ